MVNIMADTNISMTRGDTMSFGIQYEGTDQDLSDAFFTMKNDMDEVTPVLQKTLNHGISKVGTGQYVVRLAPSDTANLEPGYYYYDCEIRINGDRFTIMKGMLTLESDCTR